MVLVVVKDRGTVHRGIGHQRTVALAPGRHRPDYRFVRGQRPLRADRLRLLPHRGSSRPHRRAPRASSRLQTPSNSARLHPPRRRPGPYTLVPNPHATGTDGRGGERITVIPGDDEAHTVVSLRLRRLVLVRLELRTCFALFYADRLEFPRGDSDLWLAGSLHFVSLRRAAGLRPRRPTAGRRRRRRRPRPDPAVHAVGSRRRDGRLSRQSRVPASERRARHSRDRQILADVSEGVAAARPDDKRSWWTTVDGVEICNRVNYLNGKITRDRGARV